MVDTTQWRHVDGLTSDGTLRTNSRRVFTGAREDDRVNEDLDRVLVGEEVDDLESVLDGADGLQLLAVVTAVHHQRVRHTLHDGALLASHHSVSLLFFFFSSRNADRAKPYERLSESLVLVSSSSVRQQDLLSDLNVILS